MRALALVSLVSISVLAQDAKPKPVAVPIASRLPAGATALLEFRGVAGKLRALLASPLGQQLLAHDAVQAFRASDQGRKLLMGDAFVRGINGTGIMGVLDALASKDIAIAVYDTPQKALAVARVDGVEIKKLIAAATLFAKGQIQIVEPESDAGPALYRAGPIYYSVDNELLVVSTVEALARQVRAPTGRASVLGQANIAQARRHAGDADVFAYVDLETYGKNLAQNGKPKDLAQALLLGAFAYYVPQAPWAGVGLRIDADENGWNLDVNANSPAPEKRQQPVEDAFCGTLPTLPFRLPERTLGVVRMRRSLRSVWAHREALIADVGIPKLIEFESNFSNITYMSFVEEFLPNVGEEFVLIGTRRLWKADETAPAIRMPQGAILWPIRNKKNWATKVQLTFNQFVSIINFNQGQNGGDPLLASSVTHKDVVIHTSRYHREDADKRPPFYMNFTPSVAIVNDHLVVASTVDIVRELIDAQNGETAALGGVNAGVWLEPGEIRLALQENRETLVAQSMLEDGSSRANAEQKIDVALELARYVRDVRVTTKAADGKLSVSLRLALQTPEKRTR